MRYWDTSVLAKLYLTEADSDYYRSIIAQPGEVIYTSTLSGQELWKTLSAKRADGLIQPGGERALYEKFIEQIVAGLIVLAPLGAEVERQFQSVIQTCYNLPTPIRVRTLDALHLASAQVMAAREIVCADTRMRTAAMALGIPVYPLPPVTNGINISTQSQVK